MNGDPLEQWFTRGRPPELLATLFSAARRALLDEDMLLNMLFNRSPGAKVASGHPGITYPLFETTLIYLIFKSWLPHVHVEWESRYSDRDSRCCDLVVHQPQRLYFEAKWWSSMQQKTLAALRNDVQRLRDPTIADGRYLIAFWWNFEHKSADDDDAIRNLAGPDYLDTQNFAPRYYTRFSTIVKSDPPNKKAYFAMCAFEVQ